MDCLVDASFLERPCFLFPSDSQTEERIHVTNLQNTRLVETNEPKGALTLLFKEVRPFEVGDS